MKAIAISLMLGVIFATGMILRTSSSLVAAPERGPYGPIRTTVKQDLMDPETMKPITIQLTFVSTVQETSTGFHYTYGFSSTSSEPVRLEWKALEEAFGEKVLEERPWYRTRFLPPGTQHPEIDFNSQAPPVFAEGAVRIFVRRGESDWRVGSAPAPAYTPR